jgi:Dickkopf N-terminal cysteine-rich region
MAVVGLGACGGGGGPVPIDQLGPRVEQALCDYSVRCGSYPDVASCMSAVTDTTPQLVADVKSGKTLYDAAKAGTCLDSLGSFGCNQSSMNMTSSACDEAFKGTLPGGGACINDQECVSANCDRAGCDGTVACCTGLCAAARVTVAEGGTCGLDATCVTGTFCDFAVGGTSTCKRRGGAGAACVSSLECVSGLTCVAAASPAGTTARVCGAFALTGEDCRMTDGACDARADFCDPTTNKCVPRGVPGADCVANATSCLPYARCDAMTLKCVARGALGAPCAQGQDCTSGQCTNGACVAMPVRAVCP